MSDWPSFWKSTSVNYLVSPSFSFCLTNKPSLGTKVKHLYEKPTLDGNGSWHRSKLFFGRGLMCLNTQENSMMNLVLRITVLLNFQSLLETRVKQLMDWNQRKPVIRLNGDKYRTYLRASPRNYSVILMLTALAPHRQCTICR